MQKFVVQFVDCCSGISSPVEEDGERGENALNELEYSFIHPDSRRGDLRTTSNNIVHLNPFNGVCEHDSNKFYYFQRDAENVQLVCSQWMSRAHHLPQGSNYGIRPGQSEGAETI